MTKTLRPAMAVGELLLVLAPAAAFAQGQQQTSSTVEQIIVTAQRRAESIQKVPLSVSVRTGTALTAQGKYSLASILEDIPGINGGDAQAPATMPGAEAGGTDAPAGGLTIRGISSSRPAGGVPVSTAPAVATYVDDVYEGIGGNYDIARVEVLRGPQGTLYGRSATAGVVAIHTIDPNLTRVTADLEGEAGNYDMSRLYAAVSVPLKRDELAIRVAVSQYHINGFDNGADGESTSTDAKAKVLWRPSSDLSVMLGAALQNNDQKSGGRSLAPTSNPDALGYLNIATLPSHDNFRQYWAEANWDTGIGKLTYIPAYRTWNQNADVSLVAEGNAVETTSRTPHDTFQTHELRLASDPSSKLIWQVGAFYYANNLTNYSNTLLPGLGLLAFVANTAKHSEEEGGFGEATYPLTSYLRLTGGLRYDHTRVDVQQQYTSITGLTASIPADQQLHNFNNLTYHARLEGDVAPHSIVYAQVSTGFSPGDVSEETNSTGVQAVALNAETLTAYEIGSKNSLLDGRLILNGALFYNDYSGYQTTLSVDVSEFNSYNVPMHNYGLDLEAQYRATAQDHFGFTLGYVDAKFVDKPANFAQDYALDTPNFVIPVKADLSYQHDLFLPGGSSLSLRGDVEYISHRQAPATQFLLGIAEEGGTQYVTFPSTVLGNLGATWTSADNRYSVSAYMRNIGDNRYKTAEYVLGNDAFTGVVEPRSAWTFQPELADPRTFGVTVGAHF